MNGNGHDGNGHGGCPSEAGSAAGHLKAADPDLEAAGTNGDGKVSLSICVQYTCRLMNVDMRSMGSKKSF